MWRGERAEARASIGISIAGADEPTKFSAKGDLRRRLLTTLCLTLLVALVLPAYAAIGAPPLAGDDTLSAKINRTAELDVLANDSPTGGLTVTENTDPPHGEAFCDSGGLCSYTPDADYVGPDTFDYTVSDGVDTDIGTVSVTVVANTAPTAVDDALTVKENSDEVVVNVLSNDTDPDVEAYDDLLEVTSNTDPPHGTAVCDSFACGYKPDPGYSGPDSFDYSVSDGTDSDTGTVAVTVAANTPPVALDDTLTTKINTPNQVFVLDNDSDEDTDTYGDQISVTGNSDPPHGSATCDEFDTCTYTPDLDYVGPDSFIYTITDGTDTDTATVTVTVVRNTPPTANDDTLTIRSGAEGVVLVLANDSDPDIELGDRLSVVSNTDPAHGAASCSLDAEQDQWRCLYTSDPSYVGPDTFEYTVSDGTDTDSGTVRVTVIENTAPVARDDSLTTKINTSREVDVLANDTDDTDDQSKLRVTANTDPPHGTASCSPTGSCTYTPDHDYVGPDTFEYTVSDGSATDTGTVRVTVRDNTPPIAHNDSLVGRIDVGGSVDVLQNDFDYTDDQSNLTVASNTGATNGTVECSPGGSCTYTPNPGFVGSDAFDYTVTDGSASDTGRVAVTIIQNSGPVAGDDTLRTKVDTPGTVDVDDNDFDSTSDSLTITSNTDPPHGTATCASGDCMYTPDPGYVGPDNFDYTVSDGTATDTGRVHVTVVQNTPPVARDDSVTTTVNEPVDVEELVNDFDETDDALSVSARTDPLHGTVSCDPGCIYTPDLNFVGLDTFDYTVSDGTLTDTGTVTVRVVANTPPVALDDTLTTKANTSKTVDALGNDFDNETRQFELLVTGHTDPPHGAVSCDSEGFCRYTPDLAYVGPDSFDYTVSDGTDSDTGTVRVNIVANAPPVAYDDGVTTRMDTRAIVFVLDNDTDTTNDPLVITSNTDPPHGAASCGPDIEREEWRCIYTPDPGYIGSDAFDYTVSDGSLSDTGTVQVRVVQRDDTASSIVANDDSASTKIDTPVDVAVTANDVDAIGVTSSTDPPHGKASCGASQCTYTPGPGYVGPDSFDYTVGNDGASDTATVRVIVVANTPPLARDDTLLTEPDTARRLEGVLANDFDADNDTLIVTSNTDPPHGTASCDSAGSCYYAPEPGYQGPDSFDYTVSDGSAVDTGTVKVSIEARPPVARDDTLITAKNLAGEVHVLDNDVDTDPGSDPSSEGLLVLSSTEPLHGTASCDRGGFCIYTPDADYVGPDIFDYTLSDGSGTDVGTVNVTVTDPAENVAPVAHDDTLGTKKNESNTVRVLVNDVDIDAAEDELSLIANTDPAHGIVSCGREGHCLYTPDPDYVGPDSFDYTVSDGIASDTGNVTVSVVENTAPVARDDTVTTKSDTSEGVDVLFNDLDATGDPLTVVSNTDPPHGAADCLPDGSCLYTPDAGYVGPDSFDYTVSDGALSDTGTVMVIVIENTPPVATDDTLTTKTNTPRSVAVLENDSDATDPDEDLIVAGNTDPQHGTASCAKNEQSGRGTCTYAPDFGYVGPDTFDYTVSDGTLTDVGTVNITVIANTAPTAVDDSLTTKVDTPRDVFVLENDSDATNDPLSVTSNTDPLHGTASCSQDDLEGAWRCTYTPEAGYVGPDSFDYTVDDGSLTDTATVHVDVVTNVFQVVTKDAAGAAALVDAMTVEPSLVTGASFVTVPPGGTPNGIGLTDLNEFPIDRSTFAILTTGNINLADDPNTAPDSGEDIGGANVRGDSDFDVTILKINLLIPDDERCFLFRYKFFSEESPEFDASPSSHGDAFIAELDNSTWTTAGGVVSAPDSFAFANAGNLDPLEAAGTTYDGATPLQLGFVVPTPGPHTLYLSLLDQGSHRGDSAVFLDGLDICRGGNGGHRLSLWPPNSTNPVGSNHTVIATLTDGHPSPDETISFDVTGANPTSGSGTTDENGETRFTYTGTSAGTDAIVACWRIQEEELCATAAKTWEGSTTPGQLVVEKQTLPDGAPESFGFTSSDCTLSATQLLDGGQASCSVAAGTYEVLESDPGTNFDLTAITCDDGTSPNPSSGDLLRRAAVFKVDPGETVKCTFENTKRATLIINKTATGGDGTFGFSATGSGIPTSFDIATVDGSGSTTFTNVAPGPKSVSESSSPPGWRFSTLTCSDPDGGTTVSGQTASIDLDPGETVSCTFVNERSNLPPTLRLSPAEVTAQYSDPIPNVTATATDPDSPLSSLRIAASTLPNDLTLSTPTVGSSDVTATISGRLNVPAGDYTAQVTVTDDQGNTASQTLTIHVLRENATVSDISPAVIAVDGTDGDVDLLTVSMVVDEARDGFLSGTLASGIGLANAKPIGVTLTPVGSGSSRSCSATNTAYIANDPDSGTATCTIPDVKVEVYEAAAIIGGDYFVGDGLSAITVYDPALGFVTGGGRITLPDGTPLNFGFNAKRLRNGQLQGSLLAIAHRPEGRFKVKSNAMDTLAIARDPAGFYTATFSGKATYSAPAGFPCGRRSCGNHQFTVYIEDRAEPGKDVDRFWIRVTDSRGRVDEPISLATPAAENARVLIGGNIQVPQPQGQNK